MDLEIIKEQILKIPSVSEVDIFEAPKVYEAFVYKWTNKDTDKKYLGIHKGFVGDGYLDSSTSKQFKEDRSNSTSNFKYEILAYGDWEEIQNKETEILKSVDAENNDDWYNEHNGSGAVQSYDIDSIVEFFKRVKSGEFDCDKLEDKEDVYNIRRLQSRKEWYISETVSEVKSSLKDSAGDVIHCEPIIICEQRVKNRDGKYEDLIIDGNNTITGIYQSVHATQAPVIRIPKKVHSKLSNVELNAASNLFNKKPKIRKKPATLRDAAKHLLGVYKNTKGKIKPEDVENYKWMDAMGYNSDNKRAIRKYANVDIKQYKFELSDKVFISYDVNSPYRNEMTTKTETLRDKDTHAVYTVSNYIRLDRVMKEFRISGKRNLKVVIYFKNIDDVDKWNIKMKDEHQLEVDYWILQHPNHNSKVKGTFEWVEMPYEMDNKLVG